MKFKTISLSLLAILMIIALPACNIPQTGVLPTPTADTKIIEETIAAVSTSVVQTAWADLTAQALLNPSATSTTAPTETPAATATSTNTPLPPPTLAPTNTFIPPTAAPTLTFTPSAYTCQVTALNPARNATITKGGDFDLNVTLKNIGTSTWDANNIDFRYLSGAKFQESKDALDLPKEVKPGETVNFIIDMIANTDTGTQSATWSLVQNGSNFCTITIQIVVQ